MNCLIIVLSIEQVSDILRISQKILVASGVKTTLKKIQTQLYIFFEATNMLSITKHLKERHLHTELYSSVYVSEEHCKAYFMLYSFSGEIVGFQCYTPEQPKRGSHLLDIERRYYTYITKKHGTVRVTAFGLERLTPETKTVFLCEGVFDACRLHKLGLQALALLGSDVEHIKEQLFMLGVKLIPICEGDEAGQKLAKLATHKEVVYLPEGYDLGDMSEVEILKIIKKYI